MTTILCSGDSNTHGTQPLRQIGVRARYARGVPWPDVMAAALGEDFHVIPEGHPGRTTVLDDPIEGPSKNGMRALVPIMETHAPMDLVIIMLGTNDLKMRFSLPASDIAIGVEKLILAIRAGAYGPGGEAPRILVANPVPANPAGVLQSMFTGAAEKAQALGPLMKAVAERQNTGFIDLGEVAEVDPTDGIHLSEESHKAIGLAMAAAVGALIGS